MLCRPTIGSWRRSHSSIDLLYGTDNGYAGQARVRYWAQGINAYRAATSWPLPGSTAVRLYLAPNGADAAIHRLVRDPQQGGLNRWAAVPFGAVVCAGLDDVVNQRLSYEMLVDEEMELTGPVTVSLSFGSNEIDSHVVASTGLVSADSAYRILSMGAIRPACRKIDAARCHRHRYRQARASGAGRAGRLSLQPHAAAGGAEAG